MRTFVTLFLAFLLVSCAAFSATWASQAKLTSDKSDYQPGETVILTGSGYLPGETVTLEVHHADGSAYHSSWTVVADGSGGFTTSWVVLNDCLNHLLVATATGAASGSTASAYFWDATSWTLTISPTSSGTSETHTYTITATNTGTGVIGCITDTVPSVFTGLGSQSIVSASGHSWSITLTGNTIGLTANSNPDRLNTNETIVFSISATSPASATGSPFTWSGNAVANTNCTGASYPVPTSGQPTVSLCTPPSTSNAGPDQSVCATTATLAGSTPSVGTGAWTVIAGSASVTTPASPTSGVTGLSVGANTFVWTITASGCGSSSDTITITRSASPTTSNAGPDQTVCATTATLAGNTPTTGTGAWSVIAGSASVTTPGSPTSGVTGLSVGSNSFVWTISNGSCPSSKDTVTITRDASPTTANAGPDQTVCATTATLAGNTPIVGTGAWTVIAGSASVTTPGSPASGVTGLSVGANSFVWTISNGTCPSTKDTVTITRDASPTPSNAGPDQTVCATTATLAGNTPTVGTGAWTIIAGSASVTTPGSPTSGVTALSIGANSFVWTISNGTCPSTKDTVTITRDASPTTANAGPDFGVCTTTSSLAGNTPTVGTGAWTVIAGGGSVTTPGSPTSGVTGLSVGANTFVWTISNASCPSSSDTVTITRAASPTTASAGPDQTVCATTATLAGNTPAVGTGAWTVIAGTASVTTPGSPTSGVTGLSVGANTFVWTISSPGCGSTSDTVTITRDQSPTASNAGPDQSVCATIATLAGNSPSVGTGAWTVIAGGASITTPGSPASGVTGLSVGPNSFVWTISNATCPSSADTVTITRDASPTTSNAGPDQTVCATAATLAGNTPTVGTGTWTVIAGSASVTTPGSPTSGVTSLSVGTNSFVWTISNGTCPSSEDTVTITRDQSPTAANAGSDFGVCTTTSTLAGNAPTVGTGVWTVIAGTASVTTPSSATSGVTALSVGANTFVWTISNASCPSSSDTMTITRAASPTTASAGPDQTVCSTTATLAGNTPTVGTGSWTVIAGTASVTSPGSATSGVTGLSAGANTFVWTISSPGCGSTSDTVTITRDPSPTTAAAGPDQSVCATSATLAGNAPAVGTGAWTVIVGSASVTTAGSPTSGVTGLSVGANTFVWTISNGTCPSSSDTVTITRDASPTVATAGPDVTVCSTSTNLAGNTPTTGAGTWTVIAGGSSVTTPGNPTSGVTGLSVGANTFVWTISNGSCPSSSDTVTVTRDQAPTTANAGPDFGVCIATATLAGNAPSVGSGAWTVIAGGASVTTPGSPTSGVTGLSVGANTFVWTISNASCPSSSDTVTITRAASPTAASAGPDQTVCSTGATLAGNTPTVGTGAWAVIAGSSSVTTPGNPTSGVTGLSLGANTFVWTISSPGCGSTSDTVTFTRDASPTAANAGTDQSVCSTSTTLAGNTPAVGSGAWTVIAGSASVTTPADPASGVTGLSVGINTFVWTISNASCPPSKDTVTITRDTPPTTAVAGPDQTVCSTATALAGNTPGTGAGTWSVIAGSASVTTPASATSGVTGLSVGANTFVWTISNGSCPSSRDTVTVTRDASPTTANAGADFGVCTATTTLAGNTPVVGSGAWTVIAGGASVTTPGSPTSGVTGLSAGANTFVWTISNASCPPSRDTVTITRGASPTTASAGPDQSVCSTSATLAGNTPVVGTGVWTVIAGSGSVTTPGNPTSVVTGLSLGANTFVWSISSPGCGSTSDTVTITRNPSPTTAVAGPDQSVCASSATLAGNSPTVGTGAWSVITGSASVTTPGDPASGVTGLSNGANTFVWTISSPGCGSTSDTVTITHDPSPTVSSAGPDQTLCATTVNLAGNSPAIGSGSWTVIAGGASVTLPASPTSEVTGLTVGANTFVWTISNGSCPPSKDTVTITRNASPSGSNVGSNQTVCAGSIVTFTVTASGTGLLYQWRRGGMNLADSGNISGATSVTLTINPAGAGDAGLYDIIVSGSCPPADTSNKVTLTVNTPPDIVVQPSAISKVIGDPATFSVIATGSGLTYQWRKNGANIGGANGTSYSIPSVAAPDSGSYDVVVTGLCSPQDTSNSARLTVLPSGEVQLIGDITLGTSCPASAPDSVRKLSFGVHPLATYCIDGLLGEAELPPAPPAGVFDARFIDLRTGGGACLGNGLALDLRTYVAVTQIDTYRIRIQPPGCGYPVAISWVDLTTKYSGPVFLRDTGGGSLVNINMKTQSSYAVSDTTIRQLFIIAANPVQYIDTGSYRTFSQTDYAQKRRFWQHKTEPTPAVVRDETFMRMGWFTNGLYLGIPRRDSMLHYGWMYWRRNLFRLPRFLPHVGPARGFSEYFSTHLWHISRYNTAVKYHDNHLAGELFVLKFNVGASDVGITPSGLGDLIFNDPTLPGNPCNGLTIRQIISHTDTALTFWKQYAASDFYALDSCVSKINAAFLGPITTYTISPLTISGARSLSEVPYLHSNAAATQGVPPVTDYGIDFGMPEEYELHQNYPNPFNPTTTIQFDLPEPALVTLKIYNTLGQEVATLFDQEEMSDGIQEIDFTAAELASGVYFYRIVAEQLNSGGLTHQTFVSVKKMMLLK